MRSLLILTISLLYNSITSNGQDLNELGIGEIDFATLLSQISFEGPVPCPSDNGIQGYKNITQFVIDFALTQLFNPTPATYTICPNAVYNITEVISLSGDHLPLVVPFDDITINCGVDGKVENNCVLNGGYVHAVLGGVNTVLNGFTFQNSIGVSVVAAGPATGTATLNNCIWKKNGGYGLFFNQKFFDSVTSAVADIDSLLALLPSSPDLAELPPATGEGMTVSFENCQFMDNPTQLGLLYLNQSSIVINKGLFTRNLGVEADMILDSASSAIITDSCFVDEGERNFGVVFVSTDSTLTHEGTFSSGNTGSYCDEIYKEASDVTDCLLDPDSCVDTKTCSEFTGTSCPLIAVEPDSPVASPPMQDSPVASPPAESTDGSSSAYSVTLLFNSLLLGASMTVSFCL